MSSPSPAVAAFLSFLFPGAGQVYAGEARRGLIWAIPMFVFVLAVLWVLFGGQGALLSLISTAPKRLALLTLNVAFFLYHLAAMFDAYGVAHRERSRSFAFGGAAPIVLAILASLTIVIHGVPEAAAVTGFEQLCKIVRCDPTDPGVIPRVSFPPVPSSGPQTPTPVPSATPPPTGSPGPSGTPRPSGSSGPSTPAPERTPPPPVDLASWPLWAQDNRLNILVVGTDSRSETGVDDNSLRTDTMLLLSIDIQAGKAAMFSFPRNMCTPSIDGSCAEPGVDSRYPDWLRIPLPPESVNAYPNGIFPGMLNALWRRAAEHPESFPGSDDVSAVDCPQQYTCPRAWTALVDTIQQMSAVQIDGIVSVNLNGFVALVDNLPPQCAPADVRVQLGNRDCYGGIWIDVPTPVHEDVYRTSTGQQIELDFERGCRFFDSEMALGYARTRSESSDYDRARRQQYVLTQVRKQLDPLALLPHIPGLLSVAQQNLYMTWFDSDIPFLAEAAARIDADRIYRYDFAPNKVAALGSMQGIREKVNNIFSEPEPEPDTKPDQEPCPPKD